MGFTETLVPSNKSAESNIIIGVLDSGIYPESPSFNDEGFGPPPTKWKGVCKGGKNFTCNNKLIGARTVSESARDDNGHGTHTSSIAAGRRVENASFYGLAEGFARGGVPSARIAAYKVCGWDGHCQESEILAGFDDAIADGVDLITVSLGPSSATDMYQDVLAIGAFHAMQKGILTVQAAGNSGNDSSSVSSVAPWILSVGASTIDRRIVTKAVLGDGKNLTGKSINSFDLKGKQLPLLYGKEVTTSCSEEDAMMCLDYCLNKDLKGKIVVCNNTGPYFEALKAGAIGVLARNYDKDGSSICPLPAIEFDEHDFMALLSYLNSTRSPKATILKSESLNDTFAPVVASFSSRGPNSIASDILKPDITAPGVDILAAYSPEVPVTRESGDKRFVRYSILSGTSMACPHVAGASAYVKSIHPDWSPSAIKSALMTTARPMSPSKNLDAEFAYGSGDLDPIKARDPGLVYETTQEDYITFLCNLGYTEQQITTISGNKSTCPKKSEGKLSPNDVNYPSMSVAVTRDKPYNVKFRRTVTNVGVANSTYTAKVESGKNVEVKVTPNSLMFTSFKEKKSFEVTVVGNGLSLSMPLVSTSLVWSDEHHTVRSPIVVYIAINNSMF